MAFSSVLKITLAAGVSALALNSGALASNPEEMEARLAALEAMVAELRNELEAERARGVARNTAVVSQVGDMSDRVVELETREQPAQVTAAASPPGNGFMAGNTNITYGGFIDIDAHATRASDARVGGSTGVSISRDFYIPSATPVVVGNPSFLLGDGEDFNVDLTAQGSRFFFATSTPTPAGDIKGRLEFDFLGSPGGDQRVSNSYNPRMRVAWAELGNWRIGQDWSTFQNTAAIPESASFLVASDGMVFVRQPQIRYTAGNFQFSVENPQTTISELNGFRRTFDTSGLPDVVARYNLRRDGVNLAVMGIVRQLRGTTPVVPDGQPVEAAEFDELGWGVSVQGRVNVTESTDIRFSLTGGEGVGRYIGLNAINGLAIETRGPNPGQATPIPVVGGLVALRQEFGSRSRINVGYSFLEADNPAFLEPVVTRSVESGYAALLTTLPGGVTIGGEVLYGQRELENGTSGSITRITLSTKYAF